MLARFKKHWTWGLTAISLAGVVLNIYKDPLCFWLWVFSNAAWAIVDWRRKIYSQAVLFGIYAVLAVWGIFAWK